jgi:peptidyl-dipeptidase Dcp
MRRLFAVSLAVSILSGSVVVLLSQSTAAPPTSAAPVNAVAAPWTGPFGGVPPWNVVEPGLFPAAFEQALAEERAEFAKIASNPEPPTFENTLAAMQRAGQMRDRAQRLFSVMTANMNTPEYQALQREWQPRFAAASDEILFDPALFTRVEAVYKARERAGLQDDQRRLVELVYDTFVTRGARLGAAQKTELGRINQELAGLFAEFSAKVLADENTWTVLESEADLAGLPESSVAAARVAAEERKLRGKWVVVNTRSSVDPFLTSSDRRDLREQVWKHFKGRGDNGDANDTNATIARIVRLRAERARLLGFETHAHWRMSDTMAKEPARARELMMRVWPAAVARVEEEVADMQAIADTEGAGIRIEPWDYLYYADKVRKARYDLQQNEIKPYFELNNIVSAALWSAERRFDLQFREITGQVPVFHPDVRVWEVTDTPGGAHRGLFYLDNFARPGKRSGAWAFAYRTQQSFDRPVTAITSNNNNFVRGAPGEPVLISLDDAETLFHEFGHALHGLLQHVRYPGLATTPRDFVEYPSQVNEHWLLTREVLDRFARHYETGEPMPQALVETIERSETFNQGYRTVEYLSSAIVDMDLHTVPDGVVDADAFERETLARIGMPPQIAMRHRLPHFNHLFASDAYSAGYYSYLWSEVMDADTWRAFQEAPGGPWDKGVADRFRKYILSNGNVIDRAEAYRLFRGRDPDVRALLEQRGFPTN